MSDMNLIDKYSIKTLFINIFSSVQFSSVHYTGVTRVDGHVGNKFYFAFLINNPGS